MMPRISYFLVMVWALGELHPTVAQTMKTNSAPDTLLFDFGSATNTAWEIVNDAVMGGVSTSRFTIANGAAFFSGNVSLDNQGGFASTRSRPQAFGVAQAQFFVLRVRGDGRRYQFTARTSTSFNAPLYQAAFPTRAGEWVEIVLPLRDFVPTFRGRVLNAEPPLTAERLTSVGFLIADRQAGPFALEIAWIKAKG